jgi:hypothetical protein
MKNLEDSELDSLESRPEYTKAILDRLLGTVLIKKFGEDAMDEHSQESLAGIVVGAESPNPTSAKIEALILESESCKSIDELLLVARANGIELTDEDVNLARLEAPLE